MYDDIMLIIIILIMVILHAALFLIPYLEYNTCFLNEYLVRCHLKSITKKEIISAYTEGSKIA